MAWLSARLLGLSAALCRDMSRHVRPCPYLSNRNQLEKVLDKRLFFPSHVESISYVGINFRRNALSINKNKNKTLLSDNKGHLGVLKDNYSGGGRKI